MKKETRERSDREGEREKPRMQKLQWAVPTSHRKANSSGPGEIVQSPNKVALRSLKKGAQKPTKRKEASFFTFFLKKKPKREC